MKTKFGRSRGARAFAISTSSISPTPNNGAYRDSTNPDSYPNTGSYPHNSTSTCANTGSHSNDYTNANTNAAGADRHASPRPRANSCSRSGLY